ncbi:MAG: DUF4167 domain-containing protein [Pseudomonadota bacterium]|nr:DUF4167 domain-containing protein [Pseudomonadota bacterium]
MGGGNHHRRSNSSSGNNNVPLRHQNMDSNGPDVRIRGTPFQIHEKYMSLARDAKATGDNVAAENYFQHAEHYHRIILLIQENEQARMQQHRPDPAAHGNGHMPPADDQPHLPAAAAAGADPQPEIVEFRQSAQPSQEHTDSGFQAD